MPKTASDPSEERETSIRSLARGLEQFRDDLVKQGVECSSDAVADPAA